MRADKGGVLKLAAQTGVQSVMRQSRAAEECGRSMRSPFYIPPETNSCWLVARVSGRLAWFKFERKAGLENHWRLKGEPGHLGGKALGSGSARTLGTNGQLGVAS